MPIIPLPKLAYTADAPSPVLDQQRRPTVDNSAVRQGVQELANAQKMPELNADKFSAPYEALGAVGQALAKTGNVIDALAQKRDEALTSKQITGADDAMSLHDAAFHDQIQNTPDETEWGAMGNDSRLQVRKNLLDNPKLTPAARQELESRLLRWDAMQRSQIQFLSDKKTFGDAKAGLDQIVQSGTESQNMQMVNGAYVSGVKLGVYHPDDWARFHEAFTKVSEHKERVAKADAFDSFQETAVGFAAANGEEITLKNIDAGLLDTPGHESTPVQREQVRNAVQAYSRDRSAQARDILANGITTGEFNSPEKIDAAVKGTALEKFVTPEILSAAHQFARQRDAQAEALDREENGPRNFSQMYNQVAAYDRSKFKTDAEAQLAAFNLRVELQKKVGVKDDGWLAKQLWLKSNATPPVSKPGDEIKWLVNDKIGKMFDPKTSAYKWQWEKPVLDSKGKPILDSHGIPKTQWVSNMENEQTNAIAQTVVRQKMEEWMKLNPAEAKDPAKVIKALNGFRPEGAKPAVWESLRPLMSPAAGPQASAGTIPADLVAKVKQLEGFNPHVFNDYKQASIGYGTKARHEGETLTEPQAEARLREELGSAAVNIDTAAKQGGYKLTPGQRNALISFDFNTGKGAYLLGSAGGNVAEVKRRLLQYTKAGDKQNEGLVNRRNAEAKMFEL